MITIHIANNQLLVESPYNTDFIDTARKLSGRWIKPHWIFDPRDEALVHEALTRHYGWRPPVPGEPDVTVEITIGDNPWYEDQAPLTLCGITVAAAFGRDTATHSPRNVVVTSGRFMSSGSRKNWTTAAHPNTVFEIRDIPTSTAEAIIEHAEKSRSFASARILDPDVSRRETITAEIEDLEQRLADANARLALL